VHPANLREIRAARTSGLKSTLGEIMRLPGDESRGIRCGASTPDAPLRAALKRCLIATQGPESESEAPMTMGDPGRGHCADRASAMTASRRVGAVTGDHQSRAGLWTALLSSQSAAVER
jgi:hypothetical protein